MKNLKKYWKMMLTALICFFTGVIRKTGIYNETFDKRNKTGESYFIHNYKDFAKSQKCVEKTNSSQAVIFSKRRKNILSRNVFFWLQGPGDIIRPPEIFSYYR